MDSKDQKHNCQNRLLVISAVLCFFYYAEVKFQGASLIGANIVFKNENAVIEFSWLIWIYYYLRAYQYYREQGIDSFRNALIQTYVDELGYLLLNLTRDEFKLLPSDDPIKSSVIRIRLGVAPQEKYRTSRNFSLIRLANRRKSTCSANFSALKLNLIHHRNRRGYFHRIIRRILLTPIPSPLSIGLHAVVYPPTNRFEQQGQHNYSVSLPFSAAIKLVQFHARTIFLRPQFMENQAPLVLGLMPVWYVIIMSNEKIHSIMKQFFPHFAWYN